MGVLDGLKPEKVFNFFEDIAGIPHGSGNIRQISDYIVDFAKKRNLKYRQDEKFNVVIFKDGTKGYENLAPVIMQGHMDMVAVKTSDCNKDMTKEGLDLEIDGDWISAKNTSLGGDDGIAISYALAVLDSDELSHPPLEAIFTVDEETGLLGAGFLDVSDLKGKMFINMDSEDEGIFTISCAGGVSVNCILPYKKEKIEASVLKVKLDGFLGGHSGIEIDKGRANTNCELGRILLSAYKNFDIRIISANGGEKDNAIAKRSEADIAVNKGDIAKVKDVIKDTFEEIKAEYSVTEKDMKISVDESNHGMAEVMTKEDTLSVITLLVNMPNGVQKMNPEIDGLVQTSLNLGILKTDDSEVILSYAARSSNDTERDFLVEKLRLLSEYLGGRIDTFGEYPGWKYKSDSKLREIAVKAYEELYKKEPIVEGIHAGLECGIFADKIDGLDAISFGPDMRNVHTTDEVLSISSVERTWKLLLKILEMCK